MNCRAARRLLSRSLDGELEDPEVEELRRHLASCTNCAEYERRTLAVEDLLGSQPAPQPPEDYRDSLKESLRHALKNRGSAPLLKGHRYLFRIAASVAFVALTAVVVFLLLQIRSLERTVSRLQEGGGAASSPELGVAGHAAPPALPKNGTVGEQLQVFRSVQEDLGGRLRWLAADGRQVEIGMSGSLDKPPGRPDSRAFIFAFRFVRVEPNGTRRPISQPYVTVYPGAEARVRMKPTDGQGLSRFLYQVRAKGQDGGRIAAELTFSWSTEQQPENVEQVVWLTRTRLNLEERTSIRLGQCLHEGKVYELWGSVSSRKLPDPARGDAT